MQTLYKQINYKNEGYQKPIEQVIIFSQSYKLMTSVKL
jgi:hypothetical protein